MSPPMRPCQALLQEDLKDFLFETNAGRRWEVGCVEAAEACLEGFQVLVRQWPWLRPQSCPYSRLSRRSWLSSGSSWIPTGAL